MRTQRIKTNVRQVIYVVLVCTPKMIVVVLLQLFLILVSGQSSDRRRDPIPSPVASRWSID